jgi:multidrug efflux pump subunit AcrB
VVDAAAAVRIHSRRRLWPRAAGDRTAARLAARGHRSRHARDLGQAAGHARGSLGADFRRQDSRRRRRRAAQGDARHQLRPQIEARGDAEGPAARIGAILADQPDIRYWFLKDNGQRDLQLIIAGPDIDVINDTANQIASEMRSIPTIENPISTAELDRPELRITPKPQVAADLGVSTEALSDTIRVATLGDIDANLAKFNAGDRLVPIRVELDEAARARVGAPAGSCGSPTSSGATTPLSVVADFSISHGPTAINRYDRTRRVTIEGDLRGDAALGAAVAAIRALPTARTCRRASRSARPATSRS